MSGNLWKHYPSQEIKKKNHSIILVNEDALEKTQNPVWNMKISPLQCQCKVAYFLFKMNSVCPPTPSRTQGHLTHTSRVAAHL